MRTDRLCPGVEVEVDIRGRVFPARVVGEPANQRVPIEPLVPNNTHRQAQARQIRRILCADGNQLGLGAT